MGVEASQQALVNDGVTAVNRELRELNTEVATVRSRLEQLRATLRAARLGYRPADGLGYGALFIRGPAQRQPPAEVQDAVDKVEAEIKGAERALADTEAKRAALKARAVSLVQQLVRVHKVPLTTLRQLCVIKPRGEASTKVARVRKAAPKAKSAKAVGVAAAPRPPTRAPVPPRPGALSTPPPKAQPAPTSDPPAPKRLGSPLDLRKAKR